MRKKEVCLNNDSFGYWSSLGGVEVKKIEYGIEDYCYCISGAWCSEKSYHRVKIHYGDRDYIVLHDYKLYFDECIRM